MNDFTKEELGSIFLDMNHNILKAGKNNVAPFYLKLRDKVESLIDNYCDNKQSCNAQRILDFAKGRYDDVLFILGDRGKGYFLPQEKEQSFEMLIAKLHELHTIISLAKALIEDDKIWSQPDSIIPVVDNE